MKYVYELIGSMSILNPCYVCGRFWKQLLHIKGVIFSMTASQKIICQDCIEIMEECDPDFACGLEARNAEI